MSHLGAVPAKGGFAVHLRTLRSFAVELGDQLDALRATRDTVRTLVAEQIRLGAFAEADLLAAAHQTALADLTALLEDVQEAIAFAEVVTGTVADQFENADYGVSSSFGGGAGGGGGPVT
jgi:hypothetical protein